MRQYECYEIKLNGSAPDEYVAVWLFPPAVPDSCIEKLRDYLKRI